MDDFLSLLEDVDDARAVQGSSVVGLSAARGIERRRLEYDRGPTARVEPPDDAAPEVAEVLILVEKSTRHRSHIIGNRNLESGMWNEEWNGESGIRMSKP